MNYKSELAKLHRWCGLPSLLLIGIAGWTLFIHGYMTLGIERGIPFLRVAVTISTLYILTFMLMTAVIFPLIEKRERKIQRFKRAAKIGGASSFSILGALFLGLADYDFLWKIIDYTISSWLLIYLFSRYLYLVITNKSNIKRKPQSSV